MALERLTLASIADLDDARIRRAFEAELARLEHDLEERPMLKKPRRLTLVVTLLPTADTGGDLDGCTVAFDVKTSVPPLASKAYSAIATKGRRGLWVNELSPDDARQLTLDEEAPGPRSAADAS